MTSALKAVAVVGAILVTAIFLNPSADKHREQIKRSMAERNPLTEILGVGAFTAFVSDYHSLGVASYTSIRNETVSVGLLGMVFVLDSQQDSK